MESFHSIGQGPYGNRSTVIFKGGRFEGPSLRGEILPGGGDWEIVRDHTDPDGTEKQTAHLNTRYNLKTHDGAYIYLQTTGTRTGDRSVLTGEQAIFYQHFPGAHLLTSRIDLGSGGHSAEEFRMRLILTAETDQNNAKYSWLNQSVIIASAGREGDMVIYDAYQVV